jgi:hypothetical protein
MEEVKQPEAHPRGRETNTTWKKKNGSSGVANSATDHINIAMSYADMKERYTSMTRQRNIFDG